MTSPRRSTSRLSVALSSLLLVSACGSVDAPEPTDASAAPSTAAAPADHATTSTSSTSTTEATAPGPAPDETRVVKLDPTIPDDVWWAQPSLVIGPNDEPRVLYQSSETTAALAVCSDAECSDVSLIQVLDTGTWLSRLWAIPLPDGGAYVHARGGFGADTQRRIVCSDDPCSEPVFHPTGTSDLGNTTGVDVALDAAGRPFEIAVFAGPPSRAVSVRCQDGTCQDTSNWVTATFPDDVWLGDAAVAFDDMIPVLAFRTDRGVVLARCDLEVPGAPNCSPDSVRTLQEILVANMVRAPQIVVRPDGSPSLVLFVDMAEDPEQPGPEAIMVASCDALECAEPTLTKIAVITAEWSEPELVAAAGPDGLLWMAYSRDGRLHLTRCLDPLCQEFRESDTGFPCTDMALTFAADGRPVVATHSVDRGLELVLCRDADCVVES